MKKNFKILILEDSPSDVVLIETALEDAQLDFLSKVVGNQKEFLRELLGFHPDLILSDYYLPVFDGVSALKIRNVESPDTPFIFVSGTMGEEIAVETLLNGATDYVLKNNLEKLVPAVKRVLDEAEEHEKLIEVEEALQEKEKKYHYIVENAREGIWTVDNEAITTYVNPYMAAMLGYNADEMIGKHFLSFVDESSITKKVGQKKFNEEQINYILNRKDGEKIYTNVKSSPITDDDGEYQGSISLVSNITARKNAENKIKKQNAMLKAINNIFDISITSKTVEELCIAYLNVLTELTGSEFGFIGELNENGNLEIISVNESIWTMINLSKTDATKFIKDMEIDGIYNRILDKNASISLNNMKSYNDIEENDIQQVLTSFIGVPLKYADKPVGLIGLANKKSDYTKADQDAIEIVSQPMLEGLYRKRGELELIKSEEKFRLIAETIEEVFWIIDTKMQRIIYISPTYEKIWGRSCKSLYDNPRSWMDSIHPEDKEKAMELIWGGSDEITEIDNAGFDYRIVRPDGEVRWIWARSFFVKDHNGKYSKVVGAAQDVTKRKKAENALFKSNENLIKNEEQLRLITDNMRDVVGQMDVKGNLKYISPSVENVLGYQPDNVIGRKISYFIHPQDFKSVKELVKETLSTYAPKTAEFRCKLSDGSYIWVEASGNPIFNNDQASGIIFGLRDVEGRKIVENEIFETLQEKENLLREIHHRVKNNLQIITSLLNLQTKYVKDERDAELFVMTQDRVRSMGLVHGNLYQSESISNVNFAEYLHSMLLELFSAHGIGTQIKMDLDLEDVSLNIETAIPCGLIVNELVINSLKHAFPDKRTGKIKINLFKDDRSESSNFMLKVSDNGVGIPDNLNLENTESLGFLLIKNLTEQLEGEIELNRENGTEFKIQFKELNYTDRINTH